LPDMFGHIAQMPQILAQAGFDRAVVWRGVPSAVDRSAFRWEAPDGSSVRAEYLVAGYGNGAALPEDAKALVRRLHAHLEEFGSFLHDGDPLLLMNGSDHLRPQPWLGRVVAEANQIQSDFDLTISSLPEYLDAAPEHDLPHWHGELRSGARTNLLMGVGSNRVDVKQAAARAEQWLERMAEPLSALFLPTTSWPASLLDLAWTLVIRNAAHDSICACSIDDVVDAVLHRYAEARHIGQGLADQALAAVAASMATAGPVVVNPSARDRSGLVEVVVPAAGEIGPDIQVLSERLGLPGSMTLDGPTVLNMLGLIQGARIDDDTYITDVTLAEDETGLDITIVLGAEARDGVPVEEIKRELFTRLTARPDTEVRLTLDQPPMRRILARQTEVPGFGWARFDPAPLVHPVLVEGDAPGAITLTNGLVTVAIDPGDGTFSLNGVPGYGRLVDSGDYGDTYNYSPPRIDHAISSPDSVSVAIVDRGPVRATATITSEFTWPDRVDHDSKARVGKRQVSVVTTVELRADESLVRLITSFDNPSRDHRVRVHLPLPEAAATSQAECAFTVVQRGLTAEGRADEFPTPTFPSRRFVSSGGLTVVHEGLLEYELVDIEGTGPEGAGEARALALTLLRSTGMLSRLGMSTRPLPAGPMTPLEGPQLIGPIEVSYALQVG
ncbi:MAG TPA: glycoside hydrolase family 38 C-terminal domain-containing protein, partial [Acidimicrobiales bacterium]|nr:glycoside hydrolase family 38 C-terminal domain-containing protein [Acidimicrobiales bacterium]